jgi:hypothetical protein
MYCRALDEPRHDVAFLKLWSVLEYLTATTQPPAKTTLRRALFLSRNDQIDQQVLTHLMNFRHGAVHRGEESEYVTTLARQLRFFVSRQIVLPIDVSPKLRSMGEIAELLDLPADLAVIRRRSELQDIARGLLG